MRHERTEQIARVEPTTETLPRVRPAASVVPAPVVPAPVIPAPITPIEAPLAVALWRRLVLSRTWWATSVLVDIMVAVWLSVAFALVATFRGFYAAQPVLIVLGVSALCVLVNTVTLSIMLIRDRRAGRSLP